MKWHVIFHEAFAPEFEALAEDAQDELLAHAALLETFGPQLGRPRVDTLNGSKHANMKELRFDAADGVWRIAFAFDPERKAILLMAGDKSGQSEKRFYHHLIYPLRLIYIHSLPIITVLIVILQEAIFQIFLLNKRLSSILQRDFRHLLIPFLHQAVFTFQLPRLMLVIMAKCQVMLHT